MLTGAGAARVLFTETQGDQQVSLRGYTAITRGRGERAKTTARVSSRLAVRGFRARPWGEGVGFPVQVSSGKAPAALYGCCVLPAPAAMAGRPSPLAKGEGRCPDETEYDLVAWGKSLLREGLRFSHLKMDSSSNAQ